MIVLYHFNMFEILRFISGYLAIGCVWVLWFEWFCKTYGIGGAFSNTERYYQLTLWPLNLGVFLYTWISELIKTFFNDGGPSSN